MRFTTAAAITMGTGAAVAGTDLAIKSWYRRNYAEGERGPSIGPLTTRRLEHRSGVGNAFNSGSQRVAVAGLVAGPIIGVGLAGLATTTNSARLGAGVAVVGGLIVGAAVSNSGEMVLRRSVTDYIDLPPDPKRGQRYWVANLADFAAWSAGLLAVGTVGVALGATLLRAVR
jgi:lipoprotein signal peptidase